MVRAFYIDEDAGQRADYKRLLESGDLAIESVSPSTDLKFLEAISAEADIVIVDFDLTISGDGRVSYKGPVVAGHLRSLRSALPVVVLSGVLDDAVESAAYSATSELYDAVIDKAEVAVAAKSARRLILDLALGYQTITKALETGRTADAAALSILDLTVDLGDVQPRLAQAIDSAPSEDRTHRAAQFLLKVLRRFPGPVVSEREALLRMGVDADAGADASQLLDPARYSGVFADGRLQDMYWTSLLSRNLAADLPEAHCDYCGVTSSAMCYVCTRPFDSRHTLGLEISGAPSGLGVVRVCGYCLQATLPSEIGVPGRLQAARDSLVEEFATPRPEA